MACILPNTHDKYKADVTKLTGDKYAAAFTDKLVKKALESELTRQYIKQGMDSEEAAVKSIISAYMYSKQTADIFSRSFYPADVKAELERKIRDVKVDSPLGVKQLMKEIDDNLVTENMVNGDVNLQKNQPTNGQDLTTRSQTPTDAAKIKKISDNLLQLANFSINSKSEKGFITDLSNALEATDKGATKYADFVLVDGTTMSIRISNHNANADNYKTNNNVKDENISIVIKPKKRPNTFVSNDEVPLVEFVYMREQLDGNKMSQIATSLAQALKTGHYSDTTGIAKINESGNVIPSGKEISTLEGKQQPLNEGERKTAKEIFGTANLKVVMASEHTDPVFHIDKVIKQIEEEEKKPFKERKFHMVQFMTKHDGLPLRRFLETKMPKTVHFSITGLGNTKWEPGVMKPDDLLDRIQAFIDEGLLKPQQVTIRIDPVIPGITTPNMIEHIVQRASKMGIKMFKFSLMDSYGYTEDGGARDRYVVQQMRQRGYEWEKYYDMNNGKVEFSPRQKHFDAVYDFVDNLCEKYNIIFNTCGERPSSAKKQYKHIKFNEGCLSVKTVENTLGVKDVADDKGNQRPGACSCFGGKIDALRYDDKCASSCGYCYAHHNSDAAVNYYNEDGTLKNNAFTRTKEETLSGNNVPNTTQQQSQTTTFDVKTAEFYSGAAKGADTEWATQAKALGIKTRHYKTEDWDKLVNTRKDVVERLEKEFQESREWLGRLNTDATSYQGKLVRRDMMQADKADAIFGIARVVKNGDYDGKYPNRTGHDVVAGGTAYAVARGIKRGIPVYIFDQADKTWKEWDDKSQSFVETDTPKLTQHAATIGTRTIDDDDKKAIADVLKNTLGGKTEQAITKNSKGNITSISSKKLNGMTFKSNYKASDGLFSTMQITGDNEVFNGVDSVIVFSTDRDELNNAVKIARKNKQSIYINPSADQIKQVIHDHDKVGIYKGKDTVGRNIDNLYKNVKIEVKSVNDSTRGFMSNHDLALFAHKIQHYYNKNFDPAKDDEAIMYNVLADIRNELENLSDEDKETWKAEALQTLVQNFDYVKSVVTVNEVYDDEEIEDYENTNTEDALYTEQHSTSTMPKDPLLQGLIASFPTGKVDELDTPLYYEPAVVNNILTRTISGSKDSAEMMRRLQKASSRFTWMTQLLDNLSKDSVKNGGSGRVRSILFTKYSNLRAAQYVTINGNRIIDEGSGFATTSINLGIVANPNPSVCVFSEDFDDTLDETGEGLIAQKILDLQTFHSLDDLPQAERQDIEMSRLPLTQREIDDARQDGYSEEEIAEVASHRGLSDEQILANYKEYGEDVFGNSNLDYNNTKLAFYLAQAGIELNPDEHDLNKLTAEEMKQLKRALATIYTIRAKDGEMEREEFMKHLKARYDEIVTILDDLTGQKTESRIVTSGESVFLYADKNYIDDIFDGLSEDNKKFMQEQFLDFDEFCQQHSADADYEQKALSMYSSLLKELALSEGKPDWFKFEHFFVNKTRDKNPSKYSDLTKQELREINRKMFWRESNITKQNDRQYVWVHAPIYADKSQLHFYRVPIIDIHAPGMNVKPQAIKEIENLIKFECNRIGLAKKRWKLIEKGELKPIDVYDISKGEPGNAHKFCFQPDLNEWSTDSNGKPISLYDAMYAEGVTQDERNEMMYQAACNIYTKILQTDVLDTFDTKSKTKGVREAEQAAKEETIKNIEEIGNALRSHDFAAYNTALANINDFDRRTVSEDKKQNKESDEDSNTQQALASERIIEKYQRALTQYIRQADIKQLTISDPAHYEGAVDEQKRYAQVQAGYKRPDTMSKYGRQYMRTIYLKDFEIDMEELDRYVFDKMRETLTEAAKAAGVNIDIDGIMKSFTNINVADAQCYRSLSSYRSVRDMFGEWSDRDEQLFLKIRNGETLTADDYTQVWQTLKPFVYTQQATDWTDADNQAHKTKVGYQYKNSENVLFNMYMLFGGQDSALGQLHKFMEDYNIDTAQFESAVKVGREGLIDLNDVPVTKLYEYLEEQTGVHTHSVEHEETDEDGVTETVTYPGDPHVIHEIPYKEYGIKTSTPPHMFDVEQQVGSQLKKLLQGDIPDDAHIYLDTDGLLTALADKATKEGNRISFKVNGETIELQQEEDGRRFLDKEGYLKLYNGLLSDMILDEYSGVQEIFQSNERLGEALRDMMGTSPKYDYDIKQALRTKEDGSFVVDLKNPAIRDKVMLLMSSILKNRINKQLTKGGTAIQMACWRGNVKHDNGTYGPLKIIRNDDGTVKCMEALMPAYSRQFIESMINKDGILDPKKCKDENLLKALCYRVPTEDIYSMIPIKVVGFTPMQFGTNIMLPQEITTLTGCDFDVDKMYLFLPEFKMEEHWTYSKELYTQYFRDVINKRITSGKTISKKEKPKLARDFYRQAINERITSGETISTETADPARVAKNRAARKFAYHFFQETEEYAIAKQEALQAINDEIERRTRENEYESTAISSGIAWDIKKDAAYVQRYEIKGQEILSKEEADNIEKEIINQHFIEWASKKGLRTSEPRFIKFDTSKDISDNSAEQKRNLLLALMRGAISSPHNITKEQNPGGFDYLKDLAKEINDNQEIPMNLTEAQYLNFFELNMTGKRLIGIYANHNVAHALCQDSGLGLAKAIKIGDNDYQSLSGIYSKDKRRISRNIAEFLAASVDNAKDPVLAKLWQNNYTASTTCFLMRLGVPVKEILEMYKELKSRTDDFQKFMEKGPAAFAKYATQYDEKAKLSDPITFMEGKHTITTPNFFCMLGYYSQTIQNLETLNSILKSDSTNGAMYDITSIVDNIIKTKRLKSDPNLVGVNNLIPDFDENNDLLYQDKKAIKDEIEKKTGKNAKSNQVAYYLTWANYRQYFDKVIDFGLIDECIDLGMQLPRFSADDIKNFINAYQMQQLRYLGFFRPKSKLNKETGRYEITTTSQIIEKILEETPQKLEEYKRKYPDNEFIKMLSRVNQDVWENGQKVNKDFLIIKKIADMRSETVNAVKQAFDDLYMNPMSKKDALELVKYSLCVKGFGYDPRSFMSVIPIKTISEIPGIESMYDYFEIDNLDAFENKFIVDNKLYDMNTSSYFDKKTGELIAKSHNKILAKKVFGQSEPEIFIKVYTDSQGNSHYTSTSRNKSKAENTLFDYLDSEVLGDNTYYDEKTIESLVDNILKDANERGLPVTELSKEAIKQILSEKNSIGRYFSLNNGYPMRDYAPIAVEWC